MKPLLLLMLISVSAVAWPFTDYNKLISETIVYAPKVEQYGVSENCTLLFLCWEGRPVKEIAACNCSGEWSFLAILQGGKKVIMKQISDKNKCSILSTIKNCRSIKSN